MTPRERLIRRQSLAARLSSYPQDLLLSLNETYELLEWDSLSDTLSIPFGIALNAIYIFARMDAADVDGAGKGDVFEGLGGGRGGGGGGVLEGGSGGIHTLVMPVILCFGCHLGWCF